MTTKGKGTPKKGQEKDNQTVNGPKKFIGYCRVSSEGQLDNTSLENQRDKIINYCNFKGFELVEIFIEQGSGKNTADRPVFNQAMESLKNYDGLIVAHFDRLARSNKDLANMLDDHFSEKNGKELVLCDQNVDTTSPTGRMILQVMSVMAEFELKNIERRTREGKAKKALSGGYAGGAPRFGEKAENSELVENQQEKEIIEIIRKHRKSGKSYQAIADYLNNKNYPTKQKGGTWAAMSVSRIYQRIENK